MKCVFKHQDLDMFAPKLNKYQQFLSQTQVGIKLNDITDKGLIASKPSKHHMYFLSYSSFVGYILSHIAADGDPQIHAGDTYTHTCLI